MKHFRPVTAFFALALAFVASPAAADTVLVEVAPEPGQATYAWVPQHVPADQILMVMVDRSGPVAEGVVLLTGGRTIRIGGVESRPFAVTQAYEPAVEMVAAR